MSRVDKSNETINSIAQAAIEQLVDRASSLERSDPQKAFQLMQQASVQAREIGNWVMLAQTLTAQASSLMRLSRFPEALERTREAIPIAQQCLGFDQLTQAYLVQGGVYGSLGQYAEALESLEQAYVLSLQHDNPALRLRILNNLALAWTNLRSYAKAVELYQQCLELALQVEDEYHYGLALSNLGNVYVERGNYLLEQALPEQAKADFQTALRICSSALDQARKLGNDWVATMALKNLGETQMNLGYTEAGLEAVQQALELSQKTGDRRVEGSAWIDVARGLALQSKPEQAQQAFEHGIRVLKTIGADENLLAAHGHYAAFLESQGQLAAAFMQLKSAQKIEQRTNAKIAERQAESIEAQLEVRRLTRESQSHQQKTLELSQQNLELNRQVRLDSLTGLGNRRALDEAIETLWSYSRTTGTPLTIVLADADHFKSINDRFSHAVGDEVLRKIGQILRQSCRNHDFVARYGGEEFALVMPGLAAKDAFKRCDHLRRVVAGFDWSEIEPGLSVTMSFGFCSDLFVESSDQMFDSADRNLYEAKARGRNRVMPEETS